MHRVTWEFPRGLSTSLTRLSRSMASLSRLFSSLSSSHIGLPQPQRNKFLWFRLFRFRSPLLTESRRFLFLRLLRCFTSPRFALTDYEFIRQFPLNGRVAPFGDPWVNACLRLTMAYRSLLRPSSPLGTKAFTFCPY